jgi:hypothetical protein
MPEIDVLIYSVLVQLWISSGEGLISQLFQADLHIRLGGFDWPRPLLRMHIDGGGRPTDGDHLLDHSFLRSGQNRPT